jgi:hypothetical protein
MKQKILITGGPRMGGRVNLFKHSNYSWHNFRGAGQTPIADFCTKLSIINTKNNKK